MIRVVTLIALAILGAPAIARDSATLSPVGLPFSPQAPRAVPQDHPLRGTIVLTGMETLPEKLGAIRRETFAASVGDTLGRLNMLATDPATARFRLTATWVSIDSPFRISISSHATVRLSWRLTRIDDGRIIFDREIATSAEARGGMAPERKRGVERVALMTNIASVALCLDQSAYGRAPSNCALTPGFSYQAPAVPMITFLRR